MHVNCVAHLLHNCAMRVRAILRYACFGEGLTKPILDKFLRFFFLIFKYVTIAFGVFWKFLRNGGVFEGGSFCPLDYTPPHLKLLMKK